MSQNSPIKLRGIEFQHERVIDALKRHPMVGDAVIGFRNDEKGRLLLIAYVALREKDAVPIRELREFAKKHLYPQHVPDIFMLLPSMPRNQAGLIDYEAIAKIPLKVTLPGQGFQIPRDVTDIMLLEIFSDLLEKPVGIDEDFFAEGGHSLMAVDLLSRIEKTTGIRLPLSIMLGASTVRELSNAVVRMVAPAVEGEIIELQPGRGGPPFFFLHGDYTGGGFFSRDIARSADLDGPFMLVQPYGLTRSRDFELPDSIQAMAESHLQAIRQKQPHGPYRLAGFCNGALIAVEIARQLLQSGETVEFLGLIDPPPAYKTSPRVFTSESVNKHIDEEETRTRLLNHYYRISAEYAAEYYPAALALILVESKENAYDPTSGWAKVAASSAIHRVGGKKASHSHAIRLHADDVGMILRKAIQGLNAHHNSVENTV